jgi:CHASE2 domain-containing sensor protein
MSQFVVLSLGTGDLSRGFPTVTAQLWEADDRYPIKFTGSLPAAPEIAALFYRWQLLYTALHHRLDSPLRIEIDSADITNISQVEFTDLCQQLVDRINSWLNSPSFRSIDQPLRTHLNTTDEIRVLVETSDPLLRKIPWHLWHFFEDYPRAEVALSAAHYQRMLPNYQKRQKVRILAVLGDRRDIDVERDQAILEGLSDQAEIKFLVEPQREQLNECLWQSWDLLFFAGHSSSREQGVIQLNSTDSLTLEQLQYALRQAISQGLKLAIFNSCDGSGLAEQLADLHIPQVIVMREPIADSVAHTFLKQFLSAFTRGKSLYQSVREARERLQGLEKGFPCASWLPMIYQNPAIAPTTWQDWCGAPPKAPTRVITFKLGWRSLVSSVAITALAIAVRSVGLLQPWELQAFDQLLRSRPSESIDSRLLIVTITENDFQLPEQQQRKGSLSDLALEKLLNQLEPHQPRAIGLDIYRDSPASQTRLVDRMRQNNKLFAICKVRDSSSNHPGVAPPPEVPVDRQGFSDVVEDADGVLRRQLIAMQPPAASPCATPYALSAQLAFQYLATEGIAAQYKSDGNLQLGNVVFQRLQSRTGGYQQIDAWGYQILLNYRVHRSALDIAPTVTLDEVLAGKVTPDLIKDRIVLIGVVAQSAHDSISTPYSAGQSIYQKMPGVIVQAQLTSQLVSAVKDGRSLLKAWSIWGEVIWIFGWAIIGGLLASRWRSPLQLLLAVSVALMVLSLLCFGFLIQGVWVPLVPAAIVCIGTAGSMAIQTIEPRSLIHSKEH